MNKSNMYKKRKNLSVFCGILLAYFLLYVSSIICVKNNRKIKNANIFVEIGKKRTKEESAKEQNYNVPLDHHKAEEQEIKIENETKEQRKTEGEKKKPEVNESFIENSAKEITSKTYESNTLTWKIAGAILIGVTLITILGGITIYFYLNKGETSDMFEEAEEKGQFIDTNVKNASVEEQYISVDRQQSIWLKRDDFN